MTRLLSAMILAFISTMAFPQTHLKFSNITITEKEDVRTGPDLMVALKGAEGKETIVLFADQRYTVEGNTKVKTHNVRRSSMKNSAVYLTLTMHLLVDGMKNKRVVQRNFYMDDEREASFSETFTVKSGIDVRMITFNFDARID